MSILFPNIDTYFACFALIILKVSFQVEPPRMRPFKAFVLISDLIDMLQFNLAMNQINF